MINPQTTMWYYIGYHGQNGPIPFGELNDLIESHVITPETHVWCKGLPDWTPAGRIPELHEFLPVNVADLPPATSPRQSTYHFEPSSGYLQPPSWELNSARNRYVAGCLNFIPGVGRLYLGYIGIGLAQLLTFLFCGIGLIWAWIDALIILTGGVSFDADGRRI